MRVPPFLQSPDIHGMPMYLDHGIHGTDMMKNGQVFWLVVSNMFMFHNIWVNSNDLTATEPWKSWLIREIIPRWS